MPDKLTLEQFGQRVKAQHPEYHDMGDAELAQKVLVKYPQYSDMVQSPVQRVGARQPDTDNSFITDLGIGALKGLGNTTSGIGDLIQKIPVVGPKIIPAVGQNAFHAINVPQNTPQQIGYTGEQAGEWLIPTGAEAKAAGMVGTHLPQIARYAAPAAKVITAALESGARNKLQGGDFTTGAEVGAGGAVAGPVLRKVASGLAEVAMAPGKRLLKEVPEGVNIGQTVLNESTGIRPKTIARQLGDRINAESSNLENLTTQADQQGRTVSLQPARDIVGNEVAQATTKNAPSYIRDVNKVGDQLATQYNEAGAPNGLMPQIVSPSKARALKQGIGLNIGSWNPESQASIAPLQKRVYGSLDAGYNAAVPGSGAIDQTLSNLIPAKQAAWNVSYNPGIARNIFEKMARPTGALTGAVAGYQEGKQSDIPGGAAIGGLIGLAGGNFITSPTGEMAVARMLRSPAAVALPKGIAAQFNRKNVSPVDENPQE